MGIFSEDKPTTTISLLINNLLTDKSVLEYEPEVHLVGLLDSIKTQPVDG